MRSFSCWRIAFASLVLFVPTQASAQVNPQRVQRALFYRSSDFGDLALVDGAANLGDARDILRYRIFDNSSACYILPERDTFYFVINNRQPENAGQIWASFVTVVYYNSTNRNFLNLYRNAGWNDVQGRRLDQFERDSNQLQLDPRKFVELHTMPAAQRDLARRRFQQIASQFHGYLRQRRIDSWEYFPRVAGPVRQRFARAAALAVGLYQFQVTGRDTPERLAAIEVHRYGSTRFAILVQTPGIAGSSKTFEAHFATRAEACRTR